MVKYLYSQKIDPLSGYCKGSKRSVGPLLQSIRFRITKCCPWHRDQGSTIQNRIMDTPDNYYAMLGVPVDADSDTIKRAYRQLARRYHPDLAGEEGALQMKRINRAYDVLSDPEKRLNYDTIIGGVIDLRGGGIARPRPVRRKMEDIDDLEFSGLSIFSTRGPFHAGPKLRSQLGVISSLNGAQTEQGLLIAAGSLDGKGLIWLAGSTQPPVSFASDTAL